MRHIMLRTFVIACLSVVMLASGAFAQTTPPAPNPNDGAFEKLSPGNQKIAQALFDAQESNSTTTEPLSRDDIAAMKQDGQGWGGVFKEMKAQGLVQAKNLGQAVSRANHLAQSRTSSGTTITTGSGRTFVEGAKVKPEHGSMSAGQSGDDHGRSGSNSGRLSTFSGSGRDSSSGGNGAGNMNQGGHGKK